MNKALKILNKAKKSTLNGKYIICIEKEECNFAIKELKEAMKPKTCDGCRYLDGVICKHDRGLYCVRQFEADYFVKDTQC